MTKIKLIMSIVCLAVILSGCTASIGVPNPDTMNLANIDPRTMSIDDLGIIANGIYQKNYRYLEYKSKLTDMTVKEKEDLRTLKDTLTKIWPGLVSFNDIVLAGGTPSEALRNELIMFLDRLYYKKLEGK
jgi:hypothetical protein